jgi:predicted Ser/Thr protein kinase
MNPTPKPAPRELPAPFGRYRLLRLLGQGGMGTVYLAHDAQLDRPVALKIPHFTAADGPRPRERFYREARAAATLHHPNVCPVYDVGDQDGTPYLTMAFIEGKPLAQLARARPLTPRQSAALVRKLALALHEAHRKGIIHRDLKPENVMIDRRGEPVVMDFGLARRVRGDARLTRQGDVFGTPAYMPPEQANGDPDAMGPACDIYSLGMILYELLAGRLPFRGDALAVLVQVLAEKPPAPSTFHPGLDPALEAVCLKAIAKDPADRHRSMADLAAALTAYLRSGAAAGPPPVPAPVPDAETVPEPVSAIPLAPDRADQTTPREERRRPRRNRKARRAKGLPVWVWLAGAAGLAVLVALGFFVLSTLPHTTAKQGVPGPVVAGPADPPEGTRTVEVRPFNGRDLSGWKAKGDPGWSLWAVGRAILDKGDPRRLAFSAGEGELVNKGKSVDLYTEERFGDCTVELEFMLPRGSNSGVYLMGEYEVQLIDWPGDGNLTFQHSGGIYKTSAPRADAAGKPGEWQTLRIDFLAPRFEDGRRVAAAKFLRVSLNGRVVQEGVEMANGPTPGGLTGREAPTGPLLIQGDHGAIAVRDLRVLKKS